MCVFLEEAARVERELESYEVRFGTADILPREGGKDLRVCTVAAFKCLKICSGEEKLSLSYVTQDGIAKSPR